MAYSSGTGYLLRQALGLGIIAVIGVAAMAHRAEIREFLAGNGFTFGEASSGEQAGADERRRPAARVIGGVEIRANANGHFETRAEINGRNVDVMVDTGATVVALTYEDARGAGIRLDASDFKHQVSTANGTARVASITLDKVAIDDIIVRNVRAVVAEPGKLHVTLLGMSFLSRLSRAEMSRGVLLLQE